MLKLLVKFKRTLIVASALLLVNVPSVAVFAAGDTPPPCVAPTTTAAGIHYPTGSDSSTFTYQCTGQYANEWTNQYYVYSPVTQTRTARYDPAYAYDCTTQKWTMILWSYSPAQSSFYQSRVTASPTPDLPTNCPVITTAASPSAASGTNGSNPNGSGSSISNTGPGSNNSTNNSVGINGNTTNNNSLSANNNTSAQATSGNAFVLGNTSGGSAASGDANSVATVANLLQSSSNVFGPDTNTFVANINGDVNGDFMFDPSAIVANTGPNSTNDANNKLQVNTDNSNNTNAQINNNVDVGATSGSATVADNSKGGDATSGNATAVANLVNLINSNISSGKSFVGTVNINGNLNGDILLPQGFINQLLASSGPNSSNSANNAVDANSTTTNNNNLGTSNTVNSTTSTGSANVSGNSSAGSATSGSADNNTAYLNLTGSNVVDQNDMLVFINVLGHWVGAIVNAPAGATSAELGGGVTNSGPNSTNSTNNSVTDNNTTTNTNNQQINNNVNVHAASGNATVNGNTSGGNATTGNAKTAVNIINVNGVNINASDWFGVLFINVFGNWTGSFGVNTSAGDPIANATTSGAVKAAIKFVAGTGNLAPSNSTTTETSSPQSAPVTGSASNTSIDGVVLAAKTVKGSNPTVATISPTQKAANHYLLPVLGITLALLILLASERGRFFAKRK